MASGVTQGFAEPLPADVYKRQVIAVVVLKEPLRAVRIAAALLIVCGLVLIRLQ